MWFFKKKQSAADSAVEDEGHIGPSEASPLLFDPVAQQQDPQEFFRGIQKYMRTPPGLFPVKVALIIF